MDDIQELKELLTDKLEALKGKLKSTPAVPDKKRNRSAAVEQSFNGLDNDYAVLRSEYFLAENYSGIQKPLTLLAELGHLSAIQSYYTFNDDNSAVIREHMNQISAQRNKSADEWLAISNYRFAAADAIRILKMIGDLYHDDETRNTIYAPKFVGAQKQLKKAKEIDRFASRYIRNNHSWADFFEFCVDNGIISKNDGNLISREYEEQTEKGGAGKAEYKRLFHKYVSEEKRRRIHETLGTVTTLDYYKAREEAIGSFKENRADVHSVQKAVEIALRYGSGSLYPLTKKHFKAVDKAYRAKPDDAKIQFTYAKKLVLQAVMKGNAKLMLAAEGVFSTLAQREFSPALKERLEHSGIF